MLHIGLLFKILANTVAGPQAHYHLDWHQRRTWHLLVAFCCFVARECMHHFSLACTCLKFWVAVTLSSSSPISPEITPTLLVFLWKLVFVIWQLPGDVSHIHGRSSPWHTVRRLLGKVVVILFVKATYRLCRGSIGSKSSWWEKNHGNSPSKWKTEKWRQSVCTTV